MAIDGGVAKNGASTLRDFLYSNMGHYRVFAILIVGHFLPEYIRSTRHCCNPGDYLSTLDENLFMKMCADQDDHFYAISLVCDSEIDILRPPYYKISNSTSAGECVDVPLTDARVCEPHFCADKDMQTGIDEVIICTTSVEYYRNLNEDSKKEIAYHSDVMMTIYISFITIANTASFITLLTGAFIYFILSEMRNAEGVGRFHFCLCVGILHGLVAYKLIFSESILPNLCITQLYLAAFTMLASFSWTGVLSYDMWRRCKSNQRSLDESNLSKYYYAVGYGVPLLLILSSNLHAHGASLYDRYQFETLCIKHARTLVLYYLGLPILIVVIANVYFFIRILWEIHRASQNIAFRSERSSWKKIGKTLALNGKLFLIMGIPWALIAVLEIIASDSPTLLKCKLFLLALISSEGIVIFLSLVVFRSRIRKKIARMWFSKNICIGKNWKIDTETESSITDCNNDYGPTNVEIAGDEKRENRNVLMVDLQNK